MYFGKWIELRLRQFDNKFCGIDVEPEISTEVKEIQPGQGGDVNGMVRVSNGKHAESQSFILKEILSFEHCLKGKDVAKKVKERARKVIGIISKSKLRKEWLLI